MVPLGIVDKLVEELGALQTVVIEAEAELRDDDVVVELRRCLDQATGTIHLVIDGHESMVAAAWKTIAEAQAVAASAHVAGERARQARAEAEALRDRAREQVSEAKQHIDALRGMKDRGDARGRNRRDPKEPR